MPCPMPSSAPPMAAPRIRLPLLWASMPIRVPVAWAVTTVCRVVWRCSCSSRCVVCSRSGRCGLEPAGHFLQFQPQPVPLALPDFRQPAQSVGCRLRRLLRQRADDCAQQGAQRRARLRPRPCKGSGPLIPCFHRPLFRCQPGWRRPILLRETGIHHASRMSALTFAPPVGARDAREAA